MSQDYQDDITYLKQIAKKELNEDLNTKQEYIQDIRKWISTQKNLPEWIGKITSNLILNTFFGEHTSKRVTWCRLVGIGSRKGYELMNSIGRNAER